MECQIVLGYYLVLDFGKAWNYPGYMSGQCDIRLDVDGMAS